MTIIETEHPHIVRVEGICGGRPVVKGTRIPVWLIVGWFQDGYSPEQIQKEIYPHLSLAQIYDAMSFYHDHREEIEAEIKVNSPTDQELEQRRARWRNRRSS